MHRVTLEHEEDFDGWRSAARALAQQGEDPSNVIWSVQGITLDLFDHGKALQASSEPAFSVSQSFIALARSAICHSDPERFALLYALLLRLRVHPNAMEDRTDPLIRRIDGMAKSVRRDIHKMHAFVRFREIEEADGSRFVAWFEPDHHIVRTTAGFFVRRFASMRWSILTPELSIHWDGERLTESPGATRADAPDGDPIEAVWKTYYTSIFNPARVKVKAMTKEMPRKYWKNMPETALIGGLIAEAQARETEMVERSLTDMGEPRAAETMDSTAAWQALKTEALSCTRCTLHRCATQTVFGEGPLDAPLMFVGEQPGDQEDLAGRAFIGPAGQLFDRALAEAGVDRGEAYVTNAVKHFKYEQRGKRRLHARPNGGEIASCRWWLDQERLLIRPKIIVALGATATQALFGKATPVNALRGRPLQSPDGAEIWVTVHPSFLLRVREDPEAEYARFVSDLALVRERLAQIA